MPAAVSLIRDNRYLEHKTGISHPECPERLLALYHILDYDPIPGVDEYISRPATLSQIEAVHTPSYVRTVLSTARHRH